jgi:hypothetical protein
LSLCPEILSSSWSNLLEWLPTEFIMYSRDILSSGFLFFCLIFFSETFHIFVKLHFQILCCRLHFTYYSFCI